MKSKHIAWILTLVEVVAFVVIGLILEGRAKDDRDLVNTFWVISIVMVVSRLILTVDFRSEIDERTDQLGERLAAAERELAESTQRLKDLGKSIDIHHSSGIDDVVGIGQSYTSITHHRLQEIKDKIVRATAVELERLRFELRTPVLDEPDFYRWLYHEFESARTGTRVRIVSMDEPLEWTDTHEEREYWRHNLEAAKRGASIERVFVFDDKRLVEARNNPRIFGHRQGSDTGVVGKFVDKEKFSKNSPKAISDAGQGFIVFNDELVIVDVFSPDGQARGFITFNSTEVRRYAELYSKFDAVAQPLTFPPDP
jgi:hypothetical protein